MYGPWRKTKSEASADLSALKAQTAFGTDPSRQTVAEYMTWWIDRKEEKRLLKTRTVRTYRADIRNHVIPALGSIRLCDLKPAHVEGFMDGLKSPAVARKARAVLHAALEDAVKTERVLRNAATVIDAPTKPTSKLPKWETRHAATFAQAAKGVELAGPIFLTCLATGLRIGEALGLLWDDLEGRVLDVNRQLQTVGPARFDTLKTEQSKRKILIGLDVTGMLTDHRLTLERLGLLREIDVAWVDGSTSTGLLMFPDPRGLPWRLETLRDRFNETIKAAGVPRIRIHDMRHFHLSRLVDLGKPISYVSNRAGHSRESTTLDNYVDAFEDRMLGESVELSELLE